MDIDNFSISVTKCTEVLYFQINSGEIVYAKDIKIAADIDIVYDEGKFIYKIYRPSEADLIDPLTEELLVICDKLRNNCPFTGPRTTWYIDVLDYYYYD